LRSACRTTLPAAFATLLQPGIAPGAVTQQFEELGDVREGLVFGFRYDADGASHQFFVSEQVPWQIGPWASDAAFVYSGVAHGADRGQLVMCQGTFIRIGGEPLLHSAVPVGVFELEVSSSGTRMFHPGSPVPDIHVPRWLESIARRS